MLEEIEHEMRLADERFGPFTSAHEAYGVLAEEVAELLEAIRANDADSVQREAMQVSAVAARLACCVTQAPFRKRSGFA